MIWEAESPNTGDDMTLFANYQNSENVRAQVAEIQIYDSSLSNYDRQSLECGLAEKWGISDVSAKCEASPPLTQSEMLETMYEDDDGWLLLLAYNHVGGENNELVPGTAPQSPTESYSHIWLNDLGLTANDVESVRFYCKTSEHHRVVHFRPCNIGVKSALPPVRRLEINLHRIGRAERPNLATTRQYIPDGLSTSHYQILLSYPFYKGTATLHWDSILAKDSRWECDDAPYQTGAYDRFTTVHQIWFKKKQ